jgi:hypothetical protein
MNCCPITGGRVGVGVPVSEGIGEGGAVVVEVGVEMIGGAAVCVAALLSVSCVAVAFKSGAGGIQAVIMMIDV